MIELIRIKDPVFLSCLQVRLAEAGVKAFVFDALTSTAYGGALDAVSCRVMVDDEDRDRALDIIAEVRATATIGDAVTADSLLGGRVRLAQPRTGLRSAIDAVFLAAAVPALSGDAVLDVGAGTGAAALCLAARVPGLAVTGLELDPDLVRLARRNADASGLAAVRFVAGNLLAPPEELGDASFDHVIANPPYAEAGSGRPSPDRARNAASMEGAARLDDWLRFCARMVRPKGSVTVIHRADRLNELLAGMTGRFGGIAVLPLWPTDDRDRPAKRVIVSGRAGSKAPMRLLPGLVLHRASGTFTAEAERVLRHGEGLVL